MFNGFFLQCWHTQAILLYWLLLCKKPNTEGGLFSFFTLLAWAERVSSKNKTRVSPGLWELGPPAYCFGIWGRTGRIWPREREILQSGYRQRESGGEAGLLYFQEKSWGNTLSCIRLRTSSFVMCTYMLKGEETEINSVLFNCANSHLLSSVSVCVCVRVECGAVCFVCVCVCVCVSEMGWGVVRITVHNAEYTPAEKVHPWAFLLIHKAWRNQ